MSREALIAAILGFLAGQDPAILQDIRAALEHDIDEAGSDALRALEARLVADGGWDYFPRDPLAQRIHHTLATRFLDRESGLQGAQHVTAIADAPIALFANHLSYADANVAEVLLQRSGLGWLANRLTALAGPKVFTSRQRRFSSLCFGTIKVPQSTEVASDEAALTGREAARAARQSIDVAHQRLAAGDALLLFGEGTRSRTGGMQPMLAGVARYLDLPGTWIVPAGLTGPELLFPIDGSTVQRARVTMSLGRPIRAEALRTRAAGDRRLIVDAVGLAVAELLPPAYRGVYGNAGGFGEAGDVLRDSRVT